MAQKQKTNNHKHFITCIINTLVLAIIGCGLFGYAIWGENNQSENSARYENSCEGIVEQGDSTEYYCTAIDTNVRMHVDFTGYTLTTLYKLFGGTAIVAAFIYATHNFSKQN